MKKVIVLGIVLMMACGAANAYVLQAVTGSATDGLGGLPTITLSDTGTAKANPLDVNPGVNSEVYSTVTGAERLKVHTVVGATSWNLVVKAGSSWTKGNILLKLWSPNLGTIATDSNWALKQGSTVLYSGKFFSATSAQATPVISKVLTYTGDPIALTFAQVVPEPGSMVAMLSGLVGLVGFGIRRRK
ncbi:MAG: PEP-CTERM sorting domain-containing protein [Armatimonadota bacterium]|nr:PEP-CTERM sorting domain-containing protein [bacterium]